MKNILFKIETKTRSDNENEYYEKVCKALNCEQRGLTSRRLEYHTIKSTISETLNKSEVKQLVFLSEPNTKVFDENYNMLTGTMLYTFKGKYFTK